MTRILFIHGYIEEPTVFDRLTSLLPPTEQIRINLADEFRRWKPSGSVNVREVAQYVINQYAVNADDVVIGHSMGGWIAAYVKELTGAAVVQIASWTNPKKILFPTHNLSILRVLFFSGLTQSRFFTELSVRQYPFDESRTFFQTLLSGSRQMDRRYLWFQIQTLFAKVSPLSVQPELRIHARPDNIIAPPDEPYVEVPGDHFSLVFHPDVVAAQINSLLSDSASGTRQRPDN